ncbi:MAG: hypothetical protein HKN90_00965 [Flavobacteriaceae bacterium]|nr:hypothetical protein [Flavobacteriaceae bacterium]
MKKVIIGLLTIGFLSTGIAQTKEIQLENVTIRPLNLSYLKSVQDENTPPFVKALENKAARYDITESPVFEREFDAYEVVFDAIKKEGADGIIMATYDQNGKILSSIERYKNVSLPKTVRDVCLKQYPDYKIHKDFYLVSYDYNDESVKKIYKVQMKNGNSKKNLKIDANGIIQ